MVMVNGNLVTFTESLINLKKKPGRTAWEAHSATKAGEPRHYLLEDKEKPIKPASQRLSLTFSQHPSK
jgi:hypothetical protein